MFQKYERLCFATHLLLDLFDDLTLRPAVLSRIGPLMAALLQLSHAPLAKPSNAVQSTDLNSQEFRMTIEEYQRLQNRQKAFHTKLISLLSSCPRNICFRELMAIFGVQNAPRWLRKETQNYLIKMLMQPNGVSSLIATIYNDGLDLGADWRKLDTLSRLIAATHGKNVDEYYEAVCPQVDYNNICKIHYTYMCVYMYLYLYIYKNHSESQQIFLLAFRSVFLRQVQAWLDNSKLLY